MTAKWFTRTVPLYTKVINTKVLQDQRKSWARYSEHLSGKRDPSAKRLEGLAGHACQSARNGCVTRDGRATFFGSEDLSDASRDGSEQQILEQLLQLARSSPHSTLQASKLVVRDLLEPIFLLGRPGPGPGRGNTANCGRRLSPGPGHYCTPVYTARWMSSTFKTVALRLRARIIWRRCTSSASDAHLNYR